MPYFRGPFPKPPYPNKGPRPGTTRVRIAVAVAADGKWSATGEWDYDDEMKREESLRSLDRDDAERPHTVHFIEATIPLPESVTVEGEVESE